MSLSRLNQIIGVAVVAAVLLLAAALFLAQYRHWLGKERYLVRGFFTNIGGLLENSPVRMGGATVGQVTRVRFMPDGRIVVVAELLLAAPISDNSVLQAGATTVTGDAYLGVLSGDSRRFILPAKRQPARDIVTLPTVNYSGVGNIGEIYAHLATMAGSVVQNILYFVDEGENALPARVNRIVANVERWTEKVETAKPRLTATVDKARRLGDELGQVTALAENLRDRAALPAEKQKKFAADIEAMHRGATAVRAMWQAQQPARTQTEAAQKTIAAWAAQMHYSPRSVVGVLLTDPQYSVAATLKVIEDAYHSVTDKSLFAKLVYVAKNFLHGRAAAKNFIDAHWQGGADLTAFYRAWADYSRQTKSARPAAEP
ncbi:MAG: MlaD family protein [Planctomycetota bacterium]|jgi:ABC-type transporter Mla subunit MlaD|nr:MlaD family protein [Planctomycetota bacterium]